MKSLGFFGLVLYEKLTFSNLILFFNLSLPIFFPLFSTKFLSFTKSLLILAMLGKLN